MIFDKLFALMADKQASDIFISAGAPIHMKMHGQTIPINQQCMDHELIRKMLTELVTPEEFKRFEHTRELNTSRGVTGLGNFRINAFWQRNTIGVVVRFIQGEIPTLDALNLPPVLSQLVMKKRGLVLVVGATGSGKSTTLASMLDHRNRRCSGHILTVEDPIEYLFRHRRSVVNQREVGVDTLGWQEALRNAMRQAPDCILIGEIRDRETMQAALAYAQTGHLCLATLHANNAYHALNRIVHFFPLENRSLIQLDLAAALSCIMSQRLVRDCAGQRRPAVELLMNTRHIAELIARGALSEIAEAMEKSLAPGSQTFEQDLFRLYRAQTISLEEALTHAESPSNLAWLINNAPNPDTPALHPQAPDHPDAGGDPEDGTSFEEFSLIIDDPGRRPPGAG